MPLRPRRRALSVGGGLIALVLAVLALARDRLLAVDAEGRLLVANPGLGYVWVLNDRAEPVQVMRGVPGSSITNLAFGGADRGQIYVTDSTHGRILRATLGVPGLPLHRAARH